MPTYDYLCKICNRTFTEFRKLADYNELPECCGQPAIKIISAPGVIADIPSYTSPIDGRWIDGRKARREDLKRNRCREWEGLDQEKQEAERQKSYAEKEQDAKLDQAARQAWYQLDPQKRRLIME